MSYSPSTDNGFPCRPAAASVKHIQLPYGGASEGGAPRVSWGILDPNTGTVSGYPGDLYVQFDTAASPTHAAPTVEHVVWVCLGNSVWIAMGVQRQRFDGFYVDNIAANVSVQVVIPFSPGGTVQQNLWMPRKGRVTGLYVLASARPAAGSITVYIHIGSSETSNYKLDLTTTSGDAIIDSQGNTLYRHSTTYNYRSVPASHQFAANSIVSMKYGSSADLSPTTIDIRCALEVVLE